MSSPNKNYPRQILPKKSPKNQPKIKVVLVIVDLPHFLGPKVLITFFSTAGPSFLHGLFLSWMCMLFQLL